MQHFPEPVRLSRNTTRWLLDDLEQHEAHLEGRVHEPGSSPKTYLSVRQVADRYGVSVCTVWRWAAATTRAAA